MNVDWVELRHRRFEREREIEAKEGPEKGVKGGEVCVRRVNFRFQLKIEEGVKSGVRNTDSVTCCGHRSNVVLRRKVTSTTDKPSQQNCQSQSSPAETGKLSMTGHYAVVATPSGWITGEWVEGPRGHKTTRLVKAGPTTAPAFPWPNWYVDQPRDTKSWAKPRTRRPTHGPWNSSGSS